MPIRTRSCGPPGWRRTATRASLAPDEVDALYAATREVLPWAIGQLHELVPPRLEVEQRKFLKVH